MTREALVTQNDRIQADPMNRREAVVMKTTGLGLNSLSYFAPGLAGRFASYLWFTPFPFARPRSPEIPSGASRITFEEQESVVHGYEIGDGPKTALLIHGWAGSSRQYRRIALRLAEEGYRCVVVDLPAHGVETGSSTDLQKITDAIETAGSALGPLDLIVAHSLGAMATSMAMQGSLNAERLVLLAPAVRPHQVFESFAANLQLRPVVAKAVEDEMEDRFGDDFWDRIPEGILNMDVPDQTLIIHDLDDDMMPIEEARMLSEHWDLELVTTRGNGHNGVLRASEVIDKLTSLASTEPGIVSPRP